ncbi:MAG: cysteine desulfurase [Oscillospiraceae bacterium]|jgi:cysteine desulfurase/selenocysteine lyase|nr:cysteine desulfurase [Oscillospiraceae bacterium]
MTTGSWFPSSDALSGAGGLSNAQLSPRAYGLPDERELAALAAPYFGDWGTQADSPAYAPSVVPLDAAPGRPQDQRAGEGRGAALPRVGGVPLERIRADFPILSERVEGKPLIWLDNAATTQRPRQVVDRLTYFYEHENSNVHRGAHVLAARATDAYEAARETVARFIGAPGPENIVFVRGTTEGINLAAQSYVKPLLAPGDEIILTLLEHHANIVPWQLIAQETGAVLRVAPVDETGQILFSEYAKLFNSRTRFVSLAHVSNALGTVLPVGEMTALAHSRGVPVLVDGAQSVSHMPVNVTALDADFFVFSGHKVFGPTGIGALYGKTELLEAAKPYQGGGNMISDVTFERTVYNKPPQKFEAGTGNIADAAGLGAALDYVTAIGMENIAAYEHELLTYATAELARVPGLRPIGTAAQKASVLSFVLDGYGVADVGQALSRAGIAVRAGHHCAQPILRHFGLEGTVRPSLAFYNTPEEVDALVKTLLALAH